MEISRFFNSAPGDPRTYQASDFASYFGDVLSSGLLHTDNLPALEVKVDGTDLRTYVTPGKAIIQGYGYQNTSDLYLDHALPEATLDRIDRIVLRLDKRNQSRFIKLFVKQGDAAAAPVPPVLQRDEFIYELSLAQIRVRANTSTLQATDLIDERLDEDLCGLVYSLISIPTSQFQAQWDSYFNAKRGEVDAESLSYEQQLAQNLIDYENEFNAWFNDLQTTGYASQTEFSQLQTNFNEHSADEVAHITANERTAWNAKETPDGARKKVEQTDFKVYKSGKDSEGTFTTIEYKRNDDTIAVKSVLSGGTSPQYTTRTITYYALNGITVEKTSTRTLSYDVDGVLISEV